MIPAIGFGQRRRLLTRMFLSLAALVATAVYVGGCATYDVTLRLTDTSQRVNNGGALLVDVVRAEGQKQIDQLEDITAYNWFIGNVDRDRFKTQSTEWRVVWAVRRTEIEKLQEQREGLEAKASVSGAEGMCQYTLPKDPMFTKKEDLTPIRVFVFADFDPMTTEPSSARKLSVDPRTEKKIVIDIEKQRLLQVAPG